MRGTIYIDADAGRTIRHSNGGLLGTHVLNISGEFRAGDSVHLVVRGHDGGQRVIAIATVRCDASALRNVGSNAIKSAGIQVEYDPAIVIAAQDIALLWP